jgi:hypothetical protein
MPVKISVHVRQPAFDAVVVIAQPLVIYAQNVENGCVWRS